MFDLIVLILLTIFLFLVSYLLARVMTPIFIYAFQKLSSKTKSSLDDRILEQIKGPLDSLSFVFWMYFITHTIHVFDYTVEIIDKYVVSAIILVTAFFAVRIVKAFFDWFYEEGHKTSKIKIDINLLPFLQKLSRLIIWFIGISFSLGVLGYDISAILTITSVIGLILGLASQETLANIFAGLALQLDRPYHYGDYLRLTTGEIVMLRKIGMRTTKLYDHLGNTIIISNSRFAQERVTKIGSRGTILKNLVTFYVPNNIDITKLEQKISSAYEELKPYLSETQTSLKVHVLRIFTGNHYEVMVPVNLKDINSMVIVTDIINRKALELINEKHQ
ncbi:MAG: mechanosensitive ion channel family protein [Candidatus Micrarchaeota archaeon]|nr:mechanosensitive ion channel family protein [Candidatus Micrarchaeota archaeon]